MKCLNFLVMSMLLLLLLSACAKHDTNVNLSSDFVATEIKEEVLIVENANEEFLVDDFLDDSAYDSPAEISDPLEIGNRIIFEFNEVVYTWVFDPVYDGYVYITPSIIRTGVNNVFHNLRAPVRFVGALLQFKGEAALLEFGEFLINSTWGIGGLIRLADEDIYDEEDFGQTFGYWGIPAGPYLVIPFIGSSSIRDVIGLIGDSYLNPIPYVGDTETQLLIYSAKAVDEWGKYSGIYKEVTRGGIAVDPYLSLQSSFSQHRESRIKK